MMTKDEAIKKTLKDIEEMEAVNAVLPAVKKVVEKWDGKVFNKRFETDLKELNLPGHIYLTTYDTRRYEVNYRPEKANNWYTIMFTIRPNDKYFDPEKSFLNENKRLSKVKAFQQIEERRVKRLQEITSYRTFLATWDEKEKMLDILTKQIATITEDIPYTMRDYFGINRRLHY